LLGVSIFSWQWFLWIVNKPGFDLVWKQNAPGFLKTVPRDLIFNARKLNMSGGN
jgi:hypothetical protein